MESNVQRTVRVDSDRRGGWEVCLPDHRARITCRTLDDARRQAYLYAARSRPCHLVIRDAYQRVIDHEIINGTGNPVRPGVRR